MFKTKKYFLIQSQEQNVTYSGSTRNYEFSLITNAMRMALDLAEKFNQNIKISMHIEVCVIQTRSQEECVVSIIGNKRSIEKYINSLLIMPEFSVLFAMKEIQSYML